MKNRKLKKRVFNFTLAFVMVMNTFLSPLMGLLGHVNAAGNIENIAVFGSRSGALTLPADATDGVLKGDAKLSHSHATSFTLPSGGFPSTAGWDSGKDTKYWMIEASTLSYENLTISSKQMSSNTGPKDFKVEYSLDGSQWDEVTDATVTALNDSYASGVLTNVSLDSSLDNQAKIYLRWIMTSDTAVNNAAVANTGTSRLADVYLKGTKIGSETPPSPLADHVVISQVYGGGGEENATWRNDFVELYNPTDTAVDLEDYSIQYASSAFSVSNDFVKLTGTIEPYSYYLIQGSTGQEDSENGDELPTPDDSVTDPTKAVGLAMDAESGKVALSNQSETAISGPDDPSVVDFVGYGSADAYEGSGPTGVTLDATNSVTRKSNIGKDNNGETRTGYGNGWDTNDNKNDFSEPATPMPKNSDSPAETKTEEDETPPSYLADHVVISEVFAGGGNANTVLKNDFIELYNPTNAPVVMDKWSIQYTSSTGTFSKGEDKFLEFSGTIQPYSYFLIQGATGTNGSGDLLPKPDASIEDSASTSQLAMTIARGKVALSNQSEVVVTGPNDPNIVDFVGYGDITGAKNSHFEGTGSTSTSALTVSTSSSRKSNIGKDNNAATSTGYGNGWDSNDNSKDFSAPAKPTPKNSESPAEDKIVDEGDGDPIINPGDTAANPLECTIDKVRAVTNTYQPALLGKYVKVRGVASVATMVLDTNPKHTNFYMQDETGGVNVYHSTNPYEVAQGDDITVVGKVIFYEGLTEIELVSITKEGTGDVYPATSKTIAEITKAETAEPLEGSLIKIRGLCTAAPTSLTGNYTFKSLDSNDYIDVRVVATTEDGGPEIALGDIKQGSTYEVTGILGQFDKTSPYSTGYQLSPRSIDDIEEFVALTLEHTPITKGYLSSDVTINAKVTGAEEVKLFVRRNGEEAFTENEMIDGADSVYAFTLSQSYLSSVTGFDYYIVAANKDSSESSGTEDDPYYVVLVPDTDGPMIINETPARDSYEETYRPTIQAEIDDPAGVKTETVQMIVNGKVVDATFADRVIQYMPSTDLKLGINTVKVSAEDNLGNLSELEWTFTVKEAFTGGLHLRGTTHNHTKISSDATGEPIAALEAAKKWGYDWFAFSEHSHDIDPELMDKDSVTNKNGAVERTGGAEWEIQKTLADQYNKDNKGEFTVFPAFEMTSTTWGHANVFGTENFIDRKQAAGKYQSLTDFYGWILTYDDIAAQFNHPGLPFNAFGNFMPYDKETDKRFTMLEVGNGSGNYSYTNAQSKYFSALDLGWHLAPTFGEDNHDATWGQTKRRTVIVADENTQASLFDSMKKMRVYMTEDPNFTLDVLANGKYMGSVVKGTTLNFDIRGSDPVAESRSYKDKDGFAAYGYLPANAPVNDKIESVELLSNGTKKVAELPSEQLGKTDFSWQPSIPVGGGQQWFVVRITQVDGDKIYSAPIWSEEKAVDVRISGVEFTDGVAVEGNPAEITAGISNLGAEDLTNLTVDFYYDKQDEANRIGSTQTISALGAKKSTTVKVIWESPEIGNHDIIAVLSRPTGDEESDNIYTLSTKVRASLGMTVAIDAFHNNENSTNDPTASSKNKFQRVTAQLRKQGFTVVENKAEFTEESLRAYSIVILSNNHNSKPLSEAEQTAIAKWVRDEGGALYIAAKASHINSNYTQNNELLKKMGATIQFNRDQVGDFSVAGNFWSTPVTNGWTVRSKPTVLDNLLTDRVQTVELYSSCSLKKVENEPLTNSNTVSILARGNKTSFQMGLPAPANSVDYHFIPEENWPKSTDEGDRITGGEVIPLIAVEEVGNGRIAVAGMNFLNDSQMDESYSAKGNDELANNIIDWLSVELEHKVTDIGTARTLPDDSEVICEGVVTTKAGSFYDAIYIQDDTGGIMAFQEMTPGAFKLGDIVRIYGATQTFEGNKELIFGSMDHDIVRVGSQTPLKPKSIKTGEADENEGWLVKVKGTVISKVENDDNSYIIDDGTGEILVFTDGYIVEQTGPVPQLEVGDTYEAIGIPGGFAGGVRIRVRDTKELRKVPNMSEEETVAEAWHLLGIADDALKQGDLAAAMDGLVVANMVVDSISDATDGYAELIAESKRIQAAIDEAIQQKINEATEEVEKAEKSLLQADFDTAKVLVEALDDSPSKTELFKRLDVVKAKIEVAAVEVAVKYAEVQETQEAIDTAKALVEALADGKIKTDFLERLKDVQNVVNIGLATEAVENCEAAPSPQQENLDAAKDLVKMLLDGAQKTDLTARVVAIQKRIPHVIISQIYGAGGNKGATLKNDFVELYNPTDKPIDLSGYRIQYASADSDKKGTGIGALSGSIPAYSYYLIQCSGGANGSELPDGDAANGIAVATADGKVALVKTDNPDQTNPLQPGLIDVVDFVAFGKGKTDPVSSATIAPTLTQSVVRKEIADTDGLLQDTQKNDEDFERLTLTETSPRNTATVTKLGTAAFAVIQAEETYAKADIDSAQGLVADIAGPVKAILEARLAQVIADKSGVDQAAAAEVNDLIKSLPSAIYANKAVYDNVKKKYNDLTEDQQALVEGYQSVTDGLAKIAADKSAADNVNGLIELLPPPVYANKAEYENVKTKYGELTSDQQALVNNYDAVVLAGLTKMNADKAEADVVSGLIQSLPSAIYANKAEYESVKNKYDELTSDQQALVNNYDAVVLAGLTKINADKAAADIVNGLIQSLPSAIYENIGAYNDVKAAYEELSNEQQDLVTGYQAVLDGLAKINTDKAAADSVNQLIAKLGAATATPANKAAYEEAKRAFEDLLISNPDAAPYVNMDIVYSGLITIAAIESDQAAAEVVNKLIRALPVATIANESFYITARDAYNLLTQAQKAYVENYVNITNGLSKIAKDKSDKAAADAVVGRINNLPATANVRLSHAAAIQAARNSFNSLPNQAAKNLVTNISKLTAAEARLNAIKADAKAPSITGVSKNVVTNKKTVTIKLADAVGFASATYKIGSKAYTWVNTASYVTSASKTFSANGVYTITVTDLSGRKSTLKFTVDKVKPKVPSISRMTTKSRVVKGSAEKGSYVYIKVGKAAYKRVKANSKGAYSLKIKRQKRKTVIRVYSMDKAGNKSAVRKLTIKK